MPQKLIGYNGWILICQSVIKLGKPLWLILKGATYIPAESVYAVFEVKQDMNKFNLKYAGKKINSVRSLHRTSAPIVRLGGVDRKIKHFTILSGFLCLDSPLKQPFGTSFDKVIRSLDEFSKIDLGCVLQTGSFQIS